MISKAMTSRTMGAAGGGARLARVGLFPPFDLLERGEKTARTFLAQASEAGIDHVRCGDHVSFAGAGFDGLVQATALTLLHPTLSIYSGVYLLPLRHPVLVARQLADISRLAPGRLIFGVGVGGEDRREVSICGVDPATRGLRMNECLTLVRQLLTGTAVTFHGKFFDIDDAVIAPAPTAAIPIIIGGRSDAAIRRAGTLGDGWLGIWASPRRFADAVAMAAHEAARTGLPTRQHVTACRCGAGSQTPEKRLAPAWRQRCRPSTSSRSSASSGTAPTVPPPTSPNSSRPTSMLAARSLTSSRNHPTTTRPSQARQP